MLGRLAAAWRTISVAEVWAPQPLSSWAVEPIDMAGAARALGVSHRTLTSILKDHPIYAPRGRKKVFYPEHISGLREALERPNSPSRSGSAVGGPSGVMPAHLAASAACFVAAMLPSLLARRVLTRR